MLTFIQNRYMMMSIIVESEGNVNEKIEISLPLREQVCNIIRGRIYRGELTSGTMLSERSVSRELGISTTPVKEAFRVLTAEGLLVTLPRRGVQVTDVTTNLEYVNFIRSALEGVAAYLAARNISKDQEAVLCSSIEKVEQGLAQDKFEEVTRYNDIIHETIREASGSIYLLNLLKDLREIDKCLRVKSIQFSEEERQQSFKEHYAIVQAVLAHDSEEAEKQMVNHIRVGFKRII